MGPGSRSLRSLARDDSSVCCAVVAGLSLRRLLLRRLRLVHRKLLAERLRNARPLLQPRHVSLDRRIRIELERRRSGPVEHREEIGVGDAERVEQELAILEMLLDDRKARIGKARRVGLHLGGRVLGQQRQGQRTEERRGGEEWRSWWAPYH